MGHTITGKSYKVSYKSKKTKKNPEEKQYFFPNTHEPLIDEETFDLAQKRIATKPVSDTHLPRCSLGAFAAFVRLPAIRSLMASSV